MNGFHDRRGERCDQRLQQRDEARRIDPVVRGAVLGDEQVHLVARDRVDAGLDLVAEPHHRAIDLGEARHHRTPHALTGVTGFRRIRENRGAGRGVQAVRADDKIERPV
jgi:hypothetical protein